MDINIELNNRVVIDLEMQVVKEEWWARLFKAETWEDMKMLAKEDKTMERAISGVWQLTEEEAIREECLKREEWLMNYNWEKEKQVRTAEDNKKLKGRLKQKNSEIKQKDELISQKDEVISQSEELISQQNAEISRLKEELREAKENRI